MTCSKVSVLPAACARARCLRSASIMARTRPSGVLENGNTPCSRSDSMPKISPRMRDRAEGGTLGEGIAPFHQLSEEEAAWILGVQRLVRPEFAGSPRFGRRRWLQLTHQHVALNLANEVVRRRLEACLDETLDGGTSWQTYSPRTNSCRHRRGTSYRPGSSRSFRPFLDLSRPLPLWSQPYQRR